MKFSKKILSLFLGATLVTSTFALGAFTADATTYVNYDNFKCEVLGSSKLKIASYTGTDTDVTLPTKLGSNTVVGISNDAFEDSTITSVVIPEGYTSIGNYAFNNADALTSITLPSTITSIGNFAFANADNLASVDISKADSLSALPNGFICGCPLITSYTVPANITSVGTYAFAQGGLTTVKFANDNTTIDSYCFYKSTALTDVTLPANITKIPTYCFSGCTALADVTIPSKVTTIDTHAFSKCTGISSIKIPEGVTAINSRVFSDCTALTSIDLPVSLTTLGSYVFNGCTALTSLELSPFLTTIGQYAFNDCTALTELFIPYTVSSIGLNALYPSVQQTMNVQVVAGSSAETYCDSCFCKYEVIDNPLGDMDLNAVLDIRDVTAIQKYIAGAKTATYKAMSLGDVTANGSIDIRDVTKLQKQLVTPET